MYENTNKTAIGALEEATAIVTVATGARDALNRAVRVGADCGRVACITGALAGAKYGTQEAYGMPEIFGKLRGEKLTAPDLQGLVEQYVGRKYF